MTQNVPIYSHLYQILFEVHLFSVTKEIGLYMVSVQRLRSWLDSSSGTNKFKSRTKEAFFQNDAIHMKIVTLYYTLSICKT